MKRYFFGFSLICFAAQYYAHAQTRWSFELHGGVVHNLQLPLVIKQTGYPDIRIAKAHFQSEPLNDPFYWDWRFTKWFGSKSIEFEAIHHKLFLINMPPDVQRFGISHGFNIITLNHGGEAGKYILRAGIGSVLLHPESTIRNKPYPEGPGFDWKGYRLRGIVLNLAAARQFKCSKYFFINLEGKLTASVVNAPVVDGYARVHVVTFQLIFGPGINWSIREVADNAK